jgi:spoIIIJ-associated protein
VSQGESAVTDPSAPDQSHAGQGPEAAAGADSSAIADEAIAASDEADAPGAGPSDADREDDGGAAADNGAEAAAGFPEAVGQDPGQEGSDTPNLADLELEGEIAADYVEGLLDVADLDGDIDMDVEGDRALVSVVGATLDELVGSRGEVLEALQELTRLAVHRQTGSRTRIMIDVGGYRLRRRTELAETGREAADEVKRTGVPKKLWAMNPFERKIVHDAVAAAGLQSESEGEEPDRRVVVLPGS